MTRDEIFKAMLNLVPQAERDAVNSPTTKPVYEACAQGLAVLSERSRRRRQAGYIAPHSLQTHPPAGFPVTTKLSLTVHRSGSTDLALWLSAGKGWKTASGLWELFGGGGILGMTEGDVLPDQQKDIVAFGSLGAGWQPLAWLTLKVQLDGHTAFYRDSDLAELGSGSVQAVMGGTLHVSGRTALDIGVAEDLVVKTAPDVVFHFALRHRF